MDTRRLYLIEQHISGQTFVTTSNICTIMHADLILDTLHVIDPTLNISLSRPCGLISSHCARLPTRTARQMTAGQARLGIYGLALRYNLARMSCFGGTKSPILSGYLKWFLEPPLLHHHHQHCACSSSSSRPLYLYFCPHRSFQHRNRHPSHNFPLMIPSHLHLQCVPE
jgi:hypothetical protein